MRGLQLSWSHCIACAQDHDPWFRSLAISASPTLFAFGSEAGSGKKSIAALAFIVFWTTPWLSQSLQ